MRLNLAGVIVDVVQGTSRDHSPDEGLHRLLTAALGSLASGRVGGGVLVWFLSNMLTSHGLEPQLGACAGCGSVEANEEMIFCPREGVAYCLRCKSGGQIYEHRLGIRAMALLRRVGAVPPSKLPSLFAEPEDVLTCSRALLCMCEEHFDWQGRERRILEETFG